MMTSIGNCPIGSDTSDAPWNHSDEEMEVDVTVSLTISKTLKIKVPSINGQIVPLSDGELKKEVKNRVWLPHELSTVRELLLNSPTQKQILKDLLDWNEDDFEVILENYTPLYYGDDDSRAE